MTTDRPIIIFSSTQICSHNHFVGDVCCVCRIINIGCEFFMNVMMSVFRHTHHQSESRTHSPLSNLDLTSHSQPGLV